MHVMNRCHGGASIGLAINRSWVKILLEAKLHSSLGQVVHTYVPLTKQYNLVPVNGRWRSAAGNWEGNRRPGGK